MVTLVNTRFTPLDDPLGTFGVMRGAGIGPFFSVECPWVGSKNGRKYASGVPGESCLPEGDYRLVWHNSPKYGWAWHIVGVYVSLEYSKRYARFACLFHVGSFPRNFTGCTGLGAVYYPRELSELDQAYLSKTRHTVEHFTRLLNHNQEHRLIIERAPGIRIP